MFRKSPLLFILTALLILTGFMGMIFHHHDHDADHSDCPVCRMVEAFTGFILFAVVLWALAPKQLTGFLPVREEAYNSLILTSSVKDRAPPLLVL